MGHIVLFGTISWIPLYYFNYILALFTILLTKKFQFQLNKLFPNGLDIFRNYGKFEDRDNNVNVE